MSCGLCFQKFTSSRIPLIYDECRHVCCNQCLIPKKKEKKCHVCQANWNDTIMDHRFFSSGTFSRSMESYASDSRPSKPKKLTRDCSVSPWLGELFRKSVASNPKPDEEKKRRSCCWFC